MLDRLLGTTSAIKKASISGPVPKFDARIIVEASPIKAEATVLILRIKNENLLVSIFLCLFFIVIGFIVDNTLTVMSDFGGLFKD
jgi:hypothetical protein